MDGIGEIIPIHYEIRVDDETICFIYQTNACHSYNIVKINGIDTYIATIDTIMSFYLAFIYSDKPYYDKERLLCMCNFLFNIQKKNRTSQTGIVKRFSTECYGEQLSLRDMRSYKTEKYKELKTKKDSDEYNELFLRYFPNAKSIKKNIQKINNRNTLKKTKKSKSKTSKSK